MAIFSLGAAGTETFKMHKKYNCNLKTTFRRLHKSFVVVAPDKGIEDWAYKYVPHTGHSCTGLGQKLRPKGLKQNGILPLLLICYWMLVGIYFS